MNKNSNQSSRKTVNAADLRAKAKELLKKAEHLENESLVKIGKLAVRHYESGFKGFDVEQFKKEIEAVR